MKKVKKRGYAKLNLFLDVVGRREGFHDLSTVVVTVNLFDEVTVRERGDSLITLKRLGKVKTEGEIEKDNAYKAAKLFQEKFQTSGVDIVLKKSIPLSSGMGGSSADIVAVLLAMKELFKVKEDLKPLADALSSDGGYLLSGGYAKLSGRGDIVEKLDVDRKLYFVVATADGGVDTKDCFERFDEIEKDGEEKDVEEFIERLKENRLKKDDFYNALYLPACEINREIEGVYRLIASLSPLGVCMSGSGSSVFGVFETKELSLWALEKVKKVYKNSFALESLTEGEIERLSAPLFKSPWRLED